MNSYYGNTINNDVERVVLSSIHMSRRVRKEIRISNSVQVVNAMAVETQSTRNSSKYKLSWQAEELYARYGKPLEAEYPGDFIAISTQGKVVRAPTLQKVLDLSLRTTW